MRKKILVPVISTVFLLANCMSVIAAPVYNEDQTMDFLKEGYTDEGYYFMVYETGTSLNTMSEGLSRITVSKNVTVYVDYYDVVKPPQTYRYEAYDYEYNTTMKGTLTLDHYSHDGNVTYAMYKGTVHGNI